MVGDEPMEITEVPPGGAVGDLWNADIAGRIAVQLDVDPAALRVAAARRASDQETELPAGWTIIAVDHPIGQPKGVLGAYLAERLSQPGVETNLIEQVVDDRPIAFGSIFSLASTDTTLVIFGYDPILSFPDQTQVDPTHAEAVIEAVTGAVAALPAPGVGTAAPRATPGPPDDAEPTPAPDPEIEAALPQMAGGERLTIASFGAVRDQDLEGPNAGLFTYLLPHFEQPGTDAAIGFASSETLPTLVMAHRLTGRSGDELLAGALGEMWANPAGAPLYRGAEVDGRRYLYHQDWAFYAQGEVLYFMPYYGGYDCTDESCTFGPDVETADAVEEVVRAIPGSSSDD